MSDFRRWVRKSIRLTPQDLVFSRIKYDDGKLCLISYERFIQRFI